MNNKLDKEEDENSLDYAKKYKHHLRFDLGDVVYLKSDIKKKCPMTISMIYPFDDDCDYRTEWLNSQRKREYMVPYDKTLMT